MSTNPYQIPDVVLLSPERQNFPGLNRGVYVALIGCVFLLTLILGAVVGVSSVPQETATLVVLVIIAAVMVPMNWYRLCNLGLPGWVCFAAFIPGINDVMYVLLAALPPGFYRGDVDVRMDKIGWSVGIAGAGYSILMQIKETL